MNYKWSYIYVGNIDDYCIKNQRKYLIFFRKRLRKRLHLKKLKKTSHKSEILIVSLNS
jgi:hypothetical protein